jgi:hypothetical protein
MTRDLTTSLTASGKNGNLRQPTAAFLFLRNTACATPHALPTRGPNHTAQNATAGKNGNHRLPSVNLRVLSFLRVEPSLNLCPS